jgi:ATP-dependent Clp protease ATP-binding subunit ClpC
MFERFTEPARRTLFFSRYAATELGGDAIEPEHLLLGLLRTDRGPLPRMFALANLPYTHARAEIQARWGERQGVAQHIELPFSGQTKRILQYTKEEADRAKQTQIDTGHLLLGLLREEHSFAAEMLNRRGISLTQVREQIATPDANAEPVDATVAVEQIRFLAERLGASQISPGEKRSLIDAIHQQLDAVKQHLART